MCVFLQDPEEEEALASVTVGVLTEGRRSAAAGSKHGAPPAQLHCRRTEGGTVMDNVITQAVCLLFRLM